MGCGPSTPSASGASGVPWDEHQASVWAAAQAEAKEGEGEAGHYKLHTKWGADQAAFSVTITDTSGAVHLRVHGSTTEGTGRYFIVTFTLPTGQELTYKSPKNEILHKQTEDEIVKDPFANARVLLKAKHLKKKPGANNWVRSSGSTQEGGKGEQYTDISAEEGVPQGAVAKLPKIVSVAKAINGRILAFEGTYPDIFLTDQLTEVSCAKHSKDLLLRIAGNFPLGKLVDVSGEREFDITCAPCIQAMMPADRGLLFAAVTCGFWQPAAHGSSWAASGCYGNNFEK